MSRASAGAVRPNWPQAVVVGLGVFMATTDVSSVTIALPTVARDLDVDLPQAQWVALGYMLGTASLMLFFGRLSDLIGRRRLALVGFAIYGGFAIVSALSVNLPMLVAARIIQSIGGSMLQSTGNALMVTAFPASMRGRAMGLNGSVVSLGLLAGPIIGGLITGLLGWRFIFLLAAPLGLAALALGAWILKEDRIPDSDARMDWLGAGLLVGWTGALTYGINQSALRGLGDPLIIAVLAGGVLLVAAFLWRQLRAESPLVELRVFKVHAFTLSIGIGFLTFIGIAGHVLMTPFLLQDVMGISPAVAGALMSLTPLGAVLLALQAGAFVDRFGPRIPATLGLFMMGAATASMLMLDEHSTILDVGLRMLVVGLGQGLFMSPNSSSIMGSLPLSHIGLAGAFNAWMRTSGFVYGQAAFGLLFAAVVLSFEGVQEALQAPFEFARYGYWAVYGTAAGLFLVGAVLASTRGRVITPNSL